MFKKGDKRGNEIIRFHFLSILKRDIWFSKSLNQPELTEDTSYVIL